MSIGELITQNEDRKRREAAGETYLDEAEYRRRLAELQRAELGVASAIPPCPPLSAFYDAGPPIQTTVTKVSCGWRAECHVGPTLLSVVAHERECAIDRLEKMIVKHIQGL